MLTKDLQILMNCQVESLVPFLKGYTLRTEKKTSRKNTKEQPGLRNAFSEPKYC